MRRSQRSISGIVGRLRTGALRRGLPQGLEEFHLVLDMVNGFVRSYQALVDEVGQAHVHEPHVVGQVRK